MAVTWRKRVLMSALLLVGALLTAEVLSAYVLYRHFANLHKELLPEGSAAEMLVLGSINKARGLHPQPIISVNHGPLFDSDPALGFVMRPGYFRLEEELRGVTHYFDVTLDQHGDRITSYEPRNCTHRILMAGDSGFFGWGLNDEETIPWEVQERLPDIQVVNLSVNSYSTIQALLQLERIEPKVGANDVVAIEYHQPTNKFNVEAPDVLESLSTGYEVSIGSARMLGMTLPYGYLDAGGKLAIGHVSLHCAETPADPSCARPAFDMAAAMRVTEHAIDAIVGLHPAHLVIVFMSGPDDDPVIAHARSIGVQIADLRRGRGTPFDDDVIYTDSHFGPFFSHQVAQRLVAILRSDRVIMDEPATALQ